MIDYNKPYLMFTQDYASGLGEQLWHTSMMVSLAKYVKDNYDVQIGCYIIPLSPGASTRVTEIVKKVYDINAFNELFDEFYIEYNQDLVGNGDGKKFVRLYACGLEELIDTHNGRYSVHTSPEFQKYIKELNIPYKKFSDINWYDPSDSGLFYSNFNFFNQRIVKNADEYIKNFLPEKFESIYYRAITANTKMLNDTIKLISEQFSNNESYFVCSNWNEFKKELVKTGIDCKIYRSIDKHGNRIPDGLAYYTDSIEEELYDTVMAMSEMYIISKSSKIHVAIERYHCPHGGAFTWYPTIIKKIPLNIIRYYTPEDDELINNT